MTHLTFVPGLVALATLLFTPPGHAAGDPPRQPRPKSPPIFTNHLREIERNPFGVNYPAPPVIKAPTPAEFLENVLRNASPESFH